MNLKVMLGIIVGWTLFFAGIVIWYRDELSRTDQYFVIGGIGLFLGISIYLAVKIYKSRDVL